MIMVKNLMETVMYIVMIMVKYSTLWRKYVHAYDHVKNLMETIMTIMNMLLTMVKYLMKTIMYVLMIIVRYLIERALYILAIVRVVGEI